MLALALFFSTSAFAAPDCLDGYFDLGRPAAAIGLACESEPAQALLVFCRRETLLHSGRCTGANHPVRCSWREEETDWECREGDSFVAHLRRHGQDGVRYEFRSSFNAGVLEGTRVTNR